MKYGSIDVRLTRSQLKLLAIAATKLLASGALPYNKALSLRSGRDELLRAYDSRKKG